MFNISTVLMFELIPSLSIADISNLSPCIISKLFNSNVTISLYILISFILNSVLILSITPYE